MPGVRWKAVSWFQANLTGNLKYRPELSQLTSLSPQHTYMNWAFQEIRVLSRI